MPTQVASSASTSSRLPTATAAEILQQLDGSALKTGLASLDGLLHGGLERGKVTELWGPVGSGKTAIALTIASHSLENKNGVVWTACGSPLSSHRVQASLRDDSLCDLRCIHIATLSHLLVLIKHSDTNELFKHARLLVIDDLHALVDADYPRQASFTTSSDSELRKWQAGRRNMVLATIITSLNRLATLHHMAVIVLNGCATSNRTGSGLGTGLVSAVGGVEWDAGLWNRLVAFQDFNGRFISIRKGEGKNVTDGTTTLRFDLSEQGLLLDSASAPGATATTVHTDPSLSQSRKRVYHEIADSEDEYEYDWEAFEADVPDAAVD